MSEPPHPPPSYQPPPPPPSYPPYPPPSYPPPPYPRSHQPAGPVPPPSSHTGRLVAIAVAAGLAVVVLVAAVLLPILLEDDDEPAVDTSDLSAVQHYDDLDPTHVAPGEDVDYPQSPPVGGNHAPVWLECGAYDEPLPEEYAVHDLEHGTVWITYREDDVDGSDVAALADQLPDNGILSPYDDQDAPVVITVWGRQLELVGPEDPRIPMFVAEYGDGSTAPEPFASCHGGADPDDLAELDGSADGPVA